MTVPIETRDQSSSGSGSIHWDAPEMLFCLHAALDEDLGPGDVTAISIVPADAKASAKLVAKQDLVLAGLPLFERVFWALSPEVAIEHYFSDGDQVASGAVIARLQGPGRPILSAERTALNFLSHLSGVATLTRKFTEQVTGTQALIRDTRKTMPMLRALEKYAVRAGGGRNHRFGLFDAVLIKENHIAVAGSVGEAVRRARAGQPGVIADPQEMTAYEAFCAPQIGAGVPIQVEVRNEKEMREALAASAEALLLDNLDPQEAKRLVDIARAAKPRCVIEVSGGVNLGNVRAFADSGADFIAIGALTHSAPAADLSLLVEWAAVE